MKRYLVSTINALLVVAGLVVPTRLAAQQPETRTHVRYRVIDLGTLGGTYSQPGGINEKGEIEGFSFLAGDNEIRAFFRRRGRVTTIPGLGGPNSIAGWAPSETGQVGVSGDTSDPDPLGEDFCGFGTHLTCHPFVWRRGVITLLPLVGGNNAAANGFNNRDQVVGKAENSITDPTCPPPQVLQTQGVVWKHGRIERVLPNFPGDLQGAGHSINDRGRVVGWSGGCEIGPPFFSHALLWDQGKMIDLGTLGGDNNIAYDINNRGQVVGFSGTSDVSFLHAFLWEKGKMRDLGTLPGDAFSLGIGNNDNGDVVGGSVDRDGNERAFIWHRGVMTDLNSLIPADSPLFLFEAEDLNSRGLIIGLAVQISSGETHAFLAKPREHEDIDVKRPTPRVVGTTSRSRRSMISERARKLIQQRLASRRLGARVPK